MALQKSTEVENLDVFPCLVIILFGIIKIHGSGKSKKLPMSGTFSKSVEVENMEIFPSTA